MSVMDRFEPLTETDIRQLLKTSFNAFCAVDPMLVKECLDVLITPITKIVNKSISLDVFPRSKKAAFVKPLIIKKTVWTNILNNYRPVSNLTFLSQIIERAVTFCLNKYLFNNNVHELLVCL